MFMTEADNVRTVSPSLIGAMGAQEMEENVSPSERERVRKLIHRFHMVGNHW